MTSLWINEAASQYMIFEADRAFPLETGGVLVGYIADSGEPVVFDIVGPGPKATHRKKRFLPDHAWQCRRLDTLFEQSSGTWVYLGDWHTHPNGSSQLSWLDRRTLQNIAKHHQAEIPHPLMMIGSGFTMNWSWDGYQHRGKSLFGIMAQYKKLNIRLFRPESSADG